MKEGGSYVPANGKEEDFNKHSRIDHEVDSDDSKDSDAVQLFELPKRKLVRPLSSSLRRKVRDNNKCWATTKECCRVFVTVTVPMLIAIFIVSTMLCLAFLLVGIAGMKQEISMLKSRLKNVDAAEQNFLGKKEQLRKQFRDKLNDLVSYQTELLKVQSSVRRLSGHLHKLNTTIHSFHEKPASQLSSKVNHLKNDLDTVKSGMADTGSDIEKLKADGKDTSTKVQTLQTQLTGFKRDLYNLSVQISLIEHKKPPTLKPTHKVLVVSMTPDPNKPVARKELKKMLADLEKRQTVSCKKEVSFYDNRLEKLYNQTLLMNETYSNEISHLQQYLYTLQHPVKKPTVSTTNSSHLVNTTAAAAVNKTTRRTNQTVAPPQKSSNVSMPTLQPNVTSNRQHGVLTNTTTLVNLTTIKLPKTNASDTASRKPRGSNVKSNQKLKETLKEIDNDNLPRSRRDSRTNQLSDNINGRGPA